MPQQKRIFIVGHSGAGKGVLAQALAKKLGWKFIDADFGLVPSVGRTLTEILGSQGEEAFQHCLFEILDNQRSMENVVVTTDDSIVCHERNRKVLSSEFTVYLQVSALVQFERIAHNRPLLPVSDYKAFLNKLRKERDHLFEQVAAYSISSDNGAIDEHVSSVILAMNSMLKR